MLESPEAGPSSPVASRSNGPTPPGTPIAARARRLEDYEMDDSPRHSRESSRSLLSGHERSSSIDSLSNGRTLPGTPTVLQRIDEDGIPSEGEADGEDEFPESDTLLGNGKRRDKRSLYEGDDEVAKHRRSRTASIGQAASKAKGFIHDNRGLLMIVVSQACFAGMNVMVKLMTSNAEVAVPVWELILTRMGITWLGCYLTLRYKQIPDPLLGPKPVRGWLILRGLVGFFGLFGSYTSLQYLSLSDATVLNFLAPSVTGVLAAFFLAEPYTIKEALAGVISLAGTILVAQPEFLFGKLSQKEDNITPEERIMAVGVALLGVLAASAAYTTIRKIGKAAHALHTVSYFCMACTIVAVGTPFIIPNQGFVMPSKPIFWFYLACIGFLGFFAQYLLGRALQIERAGRCMLGNYTQLFWALLLQYFFFGETMDLLSSIGATIIMASTVWIVLTKQTAKKESSTEGSDASVEGGMCIEQEREAAKLEANLLPNAPTMTVPPFLSETTKAV